MEQWSVEKEKAAVVSRKEAEEYAALLERKWNKALEMLREAKDFYKITETHLRKKYNPDAEDEVIVVPKKNTLNATVMDVIGYVEDLIAEKEKVVSLFVKESKYTWESSSKKVQSMLETLVSVNEVTVAENMETDYKLNAKGEQIEYKYKLREKAELDYTHKEVLEELKKFNREVARLKRESSLKEEANIHFVPKYDKENTLADDLAVYLMSK